MREIDELYADSGESVEQGHGVTRGTALKIGGLGLAGALAALMPGRARGGVRKQASNSSCQGTGFQCIGSNKAKACGYDNYSLGYCFCGTVYYGKIKPKGAPVGACIENHRRRVQRAARLRGRLRLHHRRVLHDHGQEHRLQELL